MKHVDPGTGLGNVRICKQYAVFGLDGMTLLMWKNSVSSNEVRALFADGQKNVGVVPISYSSRWDRALVSSNTWFDRICKC